MTPGSTVRILAVATLALLLAITTPAAADLSLDLLDRPEVVVANPVTDESRQNPDYVFSTRVEATNGDQERSVGFDVITYRDPSTEGCPGQEADPTSVVLARKSRNLEPRETIRMGGDTQHDPQDREAFWPMAVWQEYRNSENETVPYPEGEHGFCAVALVSGQDPACEKQPQQVCIIARAPFRSFVRHGNEAPEITDLEVRPEQPRPGQQVLFRVDVEDADTEPKPDTIQVTWDLGTETRTGSVVRHSFGSGGDRTVVLTVTDGFDTVERQVNVTVQSPGTDDAPTNGSPLPQAPLLLAVLGLAAAVAGRRR